MAARCLKATAEYAMRILWKGYTRGPKEREEEARTRLSRLHSNQKGCIKFPREEESGEYTHPVVDVNFAHASSFATESTQEPSWRAARRATVSQPHAMSTTMSLSPRPSIRRMSLLSEYLTRILSMPWEWHVGESVV